MKVTKVRKVFSGKDVKELRIGLGLNQSVFWKAIGVCQSTASRYETGRKLPIPVVILIKVIYLRQAAFEAHHDVADEITKLYDTGLPIPVVKFLKKHNQFK